MKPILIITILTLLTTTAKCQGFEGEWNGFFLNINSPKANPIKLQFTWNKDSTYDIKSYSPGKTINGKDTTVVCNVAYLVKGYDSITLQETAILDPPNAASSCLQIMTLKIVMRKKKAILKGTWESDECFAFGHLRLEKTIDNKLKY